jgi:AcrR family transcriptional regulator
MASKQRPTHARRLDRTQIIRAALVLSKEPDPNAVSFRRLGAHLHVDPTAVYRHFRDKDELVAATLDALWIDAAGKARAGRPWRDELTTIAHVYRAAIVDHPAVGVDACHRSTGGPGEREAVDMVLSCLEAAGLNDAELIRFYALFSGTVLAQASAQAAARISGPTSNAAERPWIETQVPLDAERFPAMHRHRAGLETLNQDDVFVLSLELVLDAVDAAARV